ncbi:MAG: M6 family metalloprotease domain-containing protein [Gemmatimonadales bacterium]
MSRLGRATLLGVVLSLAGAAELGAQRPGAEPGRFEVPGLDWGPDAAWRTRARQVREYRRSRLAAGDMRALNGPGPFLIRGAGGAGQAALNAVTGSYFVPVITIAYADVDVAFPAQTFQDVLFSTTPPLGRPYSLKTFYEEASGGRINMTGTVFPPVRVDSNATFYQQNCNGIGVVNSCTVDSRQRFGLLLLAALDSISNRPGGDTVWSRFDNDGPDGIPNSGDDDGEVDFVTFLQPVKDGACQTSPSSPGVWAHRWVVRNWNGGSKYQTKTPRTGFPGQFILVDNYTIQSQLGGSSGCNAPLPPTVPTAEQVMAIGIVAHETGHAFGLPDLYDTSTLSGTEGVGEWDIMGSGAYSRAYSPSSFGAWSRLELGWTMVDTLGASRVVTTGPRALSDTIFYVGTTSPVEYYLIENRQPFGSDTAMLNPANSATPDGTPPCRSNCRKGPGLLLWHVDQNLIDARRFSNTVNTGSQQGVEVIQADGLNNLRSTGTARNRGDEGDPYPGTAANPAFTLRSTPDARLHTADYAGFILDQIALQPNNQLSFRFWRRDPSVIRSAIAGALVRVGALQANKYEDVIPPGDQLTVSVDSLQFTSAGRTKALFEAWSNGGTRTQTITSGATPDTLVASFSAEHRLQAVATGQGTGTVSATIVGDLAAGIFTAAGTAVTVTATPAAGAIFVGWQGDSTSANPTLQLGMQRPYDLQASFAQAVAVAVGDATTEILGTATLSTDQKNFLDLTGNRNGFFDLGDYLALLRRNGQAVPPAVLRAMAGQKVRTP